MLFGAETQSKNYPPEKFNTYEKKLYEMCKSAGGSKIDENGNCLTIVPSADIRKLSRIRPSD